MPKINGDCRTLFTLQIFNNNTLRKRLFHRRDGFSTIRALMSTFYVPDTNTEYVDCFLRLRCRFLLVKMKIFIHEMKICIHEMRQFIVIIKYVYLSPLPHNSLCFLQYFCNILAMNTRYCSRILFFCRILFICVDFYSIVKKEPQLV